MWPQPPDSRVRGRVLAAEAAGTALLVLAIVAAAAVSGTRFLLLGALVAPFVALLAVSPLGRVSGAHLNPAVSLAFWAAGRLPGRCVAGYVGAQLAGGVAGALLGRLALPEDVLASIGGAVTHPAVPAAAGIGLEAAMTAVLVLLILAFAGSGRLARFTPLAIVPVLTAIIWLGSPWTGASINPARSAGPAVAFGDFADLWIYLAAPSAAGLVTGLALRLAVTPGRAPATTPARP